MNTIQITIPKAVVTKVYQKEGGDLQYVTLASPAGEFNLTVPVKLHDFNPDMVADRRDYSFDVVGMLFGNRQSLRVEKYYNNSAGKKGE